MGARMLGRTLWVYIMYFNNSYHKFICKIWEHMILHSKYRGVEGSDNII